MSVNSANSAQYLTDSAYIIGHPTNNWITIQVMEYNSYDNQYTYKML